MKYVIILLLLCTNVMAQSYGPKDTVVPVTSAKLAYWLTLKPGSSIPTDSITSANDQVIFKKVPANGDNITSVQLRLSKFKNAYLKISEYNGKYTGQIYLKDSLFYELENGPEGYRFVQKDPHILCNAILPLDPNYGYGFGPPGYIPTGPTKAQQLADIAKGYGCIFLDYDGHTVINTYWNSTPGVPIQMTAASGIDATEKANGIAFLREVYAPYKVVITDDSTVFLAANPLWRQRIIITDNQAWYNTGNPTPAAGISFVGSMGWGDGTPSFVFPTMLDNGGIGATYMAIAHEAGHGHGLRHIVDINGDTTSATNQYFQVKGTGTGAWGQIMGLAYSAHSAYFGKGVWNNTVGTITTINVQDQAKRAGGDNVVGTRESYPGGFGPQITNSLGWKPDLEGSSFKTARRFYFDSTYRGILLERGIRDSGDVFKFYNDSNRTINLSLTYPAFGTNDYRAMMDARLELYDQFFNRIAFSGDGASPTCPPLITAISPGLYYIKVLHDKPATKPDYSGIQGSYTMALTKDGSSAPPEDPGGDPGGGTTEPPVNTANILYRETFESSTYYDGFGFEPPSRPPYAMVRNSTIKKQGSWSLRYELRDSSSEGRAEVRFNTALSGSTYPSKRWVAFWNYWPGNGMARDSKSEAFHQMHQTSSTSPPISFLIMRDSLWLEINGQVFCGQGSGSCTKTRNLGAVPKDVWTHWAFEYNLSQGSDGYVKVYKNGTLIWTENGANCYPWSSNMPTIKKGIYKWVWSGTGTSDASLRIEYVDDLRVGNQNATLNDMKSANYQ